MYHPGNGLYYQHTGYDHQSCAIYEHNATTTQVFTHNTYNNVVPPMLPLETNDPNNIPMKSGFKGNKNQVTKTCKDTSSFSIEERLVSAVWVHDRKINKTSISQIKQDFRQRFGREPPTKNTLLVWERKLFSTGSVCDAPRPGRPVYRRSRLKEVMESVAAAPSLSLRARSSALRLPRTTLRTILTRDLQHFSNAANGTSGGGKPRRPNGYSGDGHSTEHTAATPIATSK